MPDFALNQVSVSNLSFEEVLDCAEQLGCTGIEARNDLGRPLFDGLHPVAAGKEVAARGLRLLGLSQVYPFNVWSKDTASAVQGLAQTAIEAGAETISLIPLNNATDDESDLCKKNLADTLLNVASILEGSEIVALVEPLGFDSASLRFKSELVSVIDALEASEHIKLVHDTFHHTLAGGGPIYPERTGIVHISGVEADLLYDQMRDEDRVLVGPGDRLDNLGQIRALQDAGYTGVFSFECFAPEVHTLADPAGAIKQSIDFISSQTQQRAA